MRKLQATLAYFRGMLDKRTAEGALAAVEAVLEAVRRAEKGKVIRLGRALARAARDPESGSSAADAVAAEAGVPAFLLDEWGEEPGRTAEDSLRVLEAASRGFREAIRARVHPDMVPEILEGRTESGLVFLPTSLVVSLFGLGEAAADVLDGRGGGERVESFGIRVMEEAAGWVRVHRERWGVPPEWRLYQVRPPSGSDGDRDVTEEAPF